MHGSCIFKFVSPTQVRLTPYNGNGILIGETLRQLPFTGIEGSNAGLAANTTYNVFAMFDRAPKLVFSTNGHEQDPITGVEIMVGDFTHTLVGKVRTDDNGCFQNRLLTLSWFNRREKSASRHFTGGGRTLTYASDTGSFVEIHSEIRVPFLTWGDCVRFDASGCALDDTRGHTVRTCVGVDGNTPLMDQRNSFALPNITGAGGTAFPISIGFSPEQDLPEGYHFATLLGNVSVGIDIGFPEGEPNTGIWCANYPDGAYCTLTVEVDG